MLGAHATTGPRTRIHKLSARLWKWVAPSQSKAWRLERRRARRAGRGAWGMRSTRPCPYREEVRAAFGL
jgi:hypothetical protein